MIRIERGTKKYLIILIISIALCGMILYPLFDLIYNRLIANSNFAYSINKHIIEPLLFAIIYGITYWTIDKKRNKQ